MSAPEKLLALVGAREGAWFVDAGLAAAHGSQGGLTERGQQAWSIVTALPQIVAVVEAAEKIAEPEDYWDWVTGYAPQTKAALADLDEALS